MLSTSSLNSRQSARMGHFLNPAYAPNMKFDFPKPYSFTDRVKNIFYTIAFGLFWEKYIIAPQEAAVGIKWWYPDNKRISNLVLVGYLRYILKLTLLFDSSDFEEIS